MILGSPHIKMFSVLTDPIHTHTKDRISYFMFLLLHYATYFMYSKLKNWTDMSSYQSSPVYYVFYHYILYRAYVCSHNLCLATSYCRSMKHRKIYIVIITECLLWALTKLSLSLSNSVETGIRRTADLCLYAESDTLCCAWDSKQHHSVVRTSTSMQHI